MAKGRSVRSRKMAHCCLSSGTERTAVPRLARQPADADATARSTSSQGPKGAITNGTSMPSRSHRGVRSLVDTASSFQPAVGTRLPPASGSCRRRQKGVQKVGVLEVAGSVAAAGSSEESGLAHAYHLLLCDRALSDGERQGASGSLLDLLIGTLFATMAAWALGGGGDRRSPAGGSLGSRKRWRQGRAHRHRPARPTTRRGRSRGPGLTRCGSPAGTCHCPPGPTTVKIGRAHV